ncbi:MAG: hypothetical protein FWH17_01865 [Oscillospiraceae bacterium]|nr:hypothetical protein [Oscillospiraceae bacterium]
MTLTERFAALTPEQQETFSTVTDSAGLDAFLAETGLKLTADEKAQVTEVITTGKQPLSDDDLSAVAGGQDPVLVGVWKKQAESEGRGTHVGISHKGGFYYWHWVDATCRSCNVEGSLFSATKSESRPYTNDSLAQDFYDVKCYACGFTKDWVWMDGGRLGYKGMYP